MVHLRIALRAAIVDSSSLEEVDQRREGFTATMIIP
jgi:hypothetical protein